MNEKREKPEIGNSLIFYPGIQKNLDSNYTGAITKKARIVNGEYKLKLILNYLSTKKDSTCEKIALFEYQNNPTSTKHLKTITDNVRDFIKNNLIPLCIVKETGKQKIRNHHITTYSLTLFGILYTIHLFSKKENSIQTIKNLAKEYSQELPKIFGRFKEFEKVIGKNFEYFLGFEEFRKPIHISEDNKSVEILNEFIPQMYKDYEVRIDGNDLIEDQISFLFYNNLKYNLFQYQDKTGYKEYKKWQKDNNEPEIEQKPIAYNTVTKQWTRQSDGIRNYWNQKTTDEKWLKLINSNLEIKKWYNDLIKKAVKLNREKTKILMKIQNDLNND